MSAENRFRDEPFNGSHSDIRRVDDVPLGVGDNERNRSLVLQSHQNSEDETRYTPLHTTLTAKGDVDMMNTIAARTMLRLSANVRRPENAGLIASIAPLNGPKHVCVPAQTMYWTISIDCRLCSSARTLRWGQFCRRNTSRPSRAYV